MRVLVTGATGFLGRAVVTALVEQGDDVIAVIRPGRRSNAYAWSGHPSVSAFEADLRQAISLDGLGPLDAVVHVAAALTGTLPEQVAGTVLATERLLDALGGVNLKRFVLVSSFSVYDFASRKAGDVIRADLTPTEPTPARRDAYTETKLYQEGMVRAAIEKSNTELVIIRPGVIYGPSRTWEWSSALSSFGVDIVPSPNAQFRVTYVDNCADAIARSVHAEAAAGQTIDVVDDHLPTHAQYRRMAANCGASMGRTFYVPWVLLRATGLLALFVNRAFFGGEARLPEILDRPRQQARWKPLRYDNRTAKSVLRWSPTVGPVEAMRRTVRGNCGAP